MPDTKGKKSKEETSSLVRNEDQSTKPPCPVESKDQSTEPHCSVENKAGSEKQGVQQEEFWELVKTSGNAEDTTASSALQKPPGGR